MFELLENTIERPWHSLCLFPDHMTNSPNPAEEPVPLGQRLLDRPFLLLVAGLVVMFGFYTLWGLYEILTLPRATLP